LRQARRFAAEADPSRLLADLLSEAVELVGGSAGIVTRWDEDRRLLVAIGASDALLEAQHFQLGEGASGRAAERRAPVVLRREDMADPDPALVEANLESAIA